ncbi:PilZ domain-containing protein [bacterium]|jgi:c-di-GMP-binding flagellar brake protein YcgR|nr:PilZ domain-containing protein [Candidatus Omnitrophota bacterium]NCA92833.1 PilZ domain-containing protein [bacterium]
MQPYVKEKRSYPRIEARLPFQFKDIQRPIETYTGSLTKDVSTGGVRFISNEFLSIFTRLILEVSVPTFSKPIKAISKVAWIQKAPRSSSYNVGLQFVDMTEEDKKHLSNFLAKSPAPASVIP